MPDGIGFSGGAISPGSKFSRPSGGRASAGKSCLRCVDFARIFPAHNAGAFENIDGVLDPLRRFIDMELS
jgi:hypothetical protein